MLRENKDNPQAASPEIVTSLLRKTMPFSELAPDVLRRLAARCLIDFYPKGTLLLRQGETEVSYLYLIQKGGVRTFLRDEQGDVTLKDFRGEGEYFGALPIIQNSKANLNVETVEDTFCFLVPKGVITDLIQSEPRVAQHLLRQVSEKLIRTAYAELRQHKVNRTEGALYLFSVQVGEIVKGQIQTIPASGPVQVAARRMAELHIGSLLVTDEHDQIVGIITDKDLRTKVVAQGLDYATPVGQIMEAPVLSIPAHAVCFDALLAMMRSKIHHLAVERQGKIIGVATTHDIMLLQGSSPLYLFREILAQNRIENIYPLSRKVPLVIRSLLEQGAKANHITRLIAILNDHILDRLLSLQVEEMGPPPLRFCWVLMGSEGRREQTFKTDQDNALLWEDTDDQALAVQAEGYFKELGEKMIAHLVASGYPLCPGGIMASNPQWRQPLAVWRRYFDHWLYTPDPQEVLNATIFFDFRGAPGQADLAGELRQYLTKQVRSQEIFLVHLAKDLLKTRPPLSFFRHFIVEKNGEHKNTLDLKTRGLAPFVDFARLMALRYGIGECNTLERLRLLAEGRHLPQELYTEMTAAYEFIMQLRLVHQLRMLEEGSQPNNHINPGELSDLEKQTLKEAFGVIWRLQSHVKLEFHLD